MERYHSSDAMRRTFVFLEVDGEVFDFWEDYTISSDLLNGSDTFNFHAPAFPRANEGIRQTELDARGIRRGMRVRIFVKTPATSRPIPVMVGAIDDVEMTEDRERGAMVSITGRDHMSPLVDCDVLPSLALENVTFDTAIRKLLTEKHPGQPAPFFKAADILINNDANRAMSTGQPARGTTLSSKAPIDLESFKVDQLKPNPGETIFAFLSRHATRFGLMIWGTADGKIVFGRPNYDQKPLYRVSMRQGVAGAGNSATVMRRRLSFKHRATEVHVYGRSRGGDHMSSSIHAVEYDEEVRATGLWRALTIHDNNARTKEQATQRAKLELSMRKQTGDVLTVGLEGHVADDGAIYAIDTIANVEWDKGGISDARYVISRTFSRSRGAGTATTLELVPRGAINIGNV